MLTSLLNLSKKVGVASRHGQWPVLLATMAGLYAPVVSGVTSPPAADAVVVFLSVPGTRINVTTLEFYRAANDEIAQTKAWSLVGGGELGRSASVKGLSFVGKVPVLTASPSLRATRRRVIPQVQETLDTLAIQGAIIVDCQTITGSTQETARVRGCGLYYYDRAEGRIVAATRKSFRVGVNSASLWAFSMVQGLKGGLEAHKAKIDRERLSSIESKSDDAEKPARPYLVLGMVGESLQLRGGERANLAGGVAGFGASFSGRSLGLEYAQTSFQGRHGTQQDRYNSRSLEVVLGASADAMDIVTWGLDLTAGMTERRYEKAEEEVLWARQPVIGLRPGVFWKVRQGWLMGATVSYRAAYGGEERVSASIDERNNSGFRATSWSTGFNTRLEF